MRLKKELLISLTTIFIIYPQTALAQFMPQFNIPKPPEFRINNLGLLFSSLVSVALVFSGIASFANLLIGGFLWIISGGNEEKVGAAQRRIQAALIGLFVVFSSWGIMQLVQSFLGINFLGTAILLPKPY